jgi:transposase InsO family protein
VCHGSSWGCGFAGPPRLTGPEQRLLGIAVRTPSSREREHIFLSGKYARQDRKYWTREDAVEDIRDYIDFYNGRRRHSYLDGLCPVEFENRAILT